VNRKPLIVTGMHRSGTSYVASLLFAAGAFVGDRLLGSNFANLRGHFEDLDFTSLHERMLDAHGALRSGWTLTNSEAVEKTFEAEALALVGARAQWATWGWKDPRNSLFLHFWSELLPEACFVCIYRRPWEVVDSLFRRGDWDIGTDPLLAERAWIDHNARILEFRRRHPERCVLAAVQGVAADDAGFLQLLRDRFGVALRAPENRVFDRGLMRRLRPGCFEEQMIRVYRPDAFRLYGELEAAADLPGGEPARGAAEASNLAAPLFAQWQWVRSLESNIQMLRLRVDLSVQATQKDVEPEGGIE
jgi:O-antigen biosynthesis protein